MLVHTKKNPGIKLQVARCLWVWRYFAGFADIFLHLRILSQLLCGCISSCCFPRLLLRVCTGVVAFSEFCSHICMRLSWFLKNKIYRRAPLDCAPTNETLSRMRELNLVAHGGRFWNCFAHTVHNTEMYFFFAPVRICIHTYSNSNMNACVWIRNMYICVYLFLHIYTCVYICILINTH